MKSKLFNYRMLKKVMLPTVLLLSFLGYYVYTNKKIEQLSYKIGKLENKTKQYDNKLDDNNFSKKVIQAVKDYVLEEQKEIVNLKYQNYANVPDEKSGDHYLYGSPDARFTLLIFSEIECPYCQKFHETPKSLVNESNGEINIKWMHFPLPFHNPAAEKEALAAECIAEQKGNKGFWLAIDEMFKMTKSGGQGVNSLINIAQSTGVNVNQFSICINEERYMERIKNQISIGNRLGVNSTPTTVIIDNKTLKRFTVSGAQPGVAIKSIINRMVSEDIELNRTE